MVKQADESGKSYTLTIIRDIREKRVGELELESFPAVASELRDMFMVYCDGMHTALSGFVSKDRATPLADPQGIAVLVYFGGDTEDFKSLPAVGERKR